MICIYNNKEHNGRLIDQETIVVRTYPVRLNAPNRRAVVQPRMQISKLQTYRHTNSEQIQACRPAGVKNYKLADVFMFFFFLFSFPSLFVSYSNKKHTRLPPHRHRTVQTCCLFFFKWNTSLTPYRHDETTSLPPHRQQNYKLAATQAQHKTTSLPPHRRNTKQRASSLQPHRRQNFFFAFFFSFLFRRHTGVVQNYKLAATQA